jgi:hypothetical protein
VEGSREKESAPSTDGDGGKQILLQKRVFGGHDLAVLLL